MAVTQIVDLTSDVLPHLNMAQVPPDGGAELTNFILDATDVVEDIVGHVVPATFDEFYDGGDTTIYLRELPVLTVTSIVEIIGLTAYSITDQAVGQATDDFGFTVDVPRLGRVTRRSAGSVPYPFYRNTGNVEVVYTAGRATVPGNVRMATLELIRNWYQSGQQAASKSSFTPDGGADQDEGYSASPSGYLVPNRVKQILQPSLRPIVIA